MIVKLEKISTRKDGNINAYFTHPKALNGASLIFPTNMWEFLKSKHDQDRKEFKDDTD